VVCNLRGFGHVSSQESSQERISYIVFARGSNPGLKPRGDHALAPNSAALSLAGNIALLLMGKEGLGSKWMDEQRNDNCTVPIDKRGNKPRPSAYPHFSVG
jgi:hypothetical protein